MPRCVLAALCCVSLCMCSIWSANFTSPYPQVDSRFGNQVAVSGAWAVVQASYATRSDTDDTRTGAAFMYHQNQDGVWEYDCRLPVSDTTATDIGFTVAIDGDWAGVGVHFNNTYNSAVYLYHLINGVWTKADTINSPGPAEIFGQSLAMGGGVLVVGFPNYDYDSGEALVYRLSSDRYRREGTLKGKDIGFPTGNGDNVAVSADGTWVVMGSDSNGQVNVYDYAPSGGRVKWTHTGTLPGVRCYEETTLCITADGATVGVGCHTWSNPVDYAGHVQMYRQDGEGTFSLVQTLDGGNKYYSTYAYSVDISSDGQRLAVGATMGNSVYVYTLGTDGLYTLADTESADYNTALGNSVAFGGVDGDVLLGGVPEVNDYAGLVGVFDLTLL
ncbi:hypothetical protein KIPB_002982 [Kipferlia bialata]|uniref:Uncharacterized protein n=1 Tax=Kipferlia bialata TaxID=797122 RepID=A0A9K3CT31_9EUKA|nr:hypothetical protein KIPB_002982 [Kipferlia bialata]|eukprot:g2982.t1